jgi:hypothetical protein
MRYGLIAAVHVGQRERLRLTNGGSLLKPEPIKVVVSLRLRRPFGLAGSAG